MKIGSNCSISQLLCKLKLCSFVYISKSSKPVPSKSWHPLHLSLRRNKSLRSLYPCVHDRHIVLLSIQCKCSIPIVFLWKYVLCFYCFLPIFKNNPFPPTKFDWVGLFLIVVSVGCGNTRGLPILGERGITGLVEFW